MSTRAYTANHYVPQWYQSRFLPAEGEAKFRYLDLKPESFRDAKGVVRTKTNLRRWGTRKCFQEDDLYTTQFGSWRSNDIEKFFFGRVDSKGAKAIEWFAAFDHLNFRVSSEAFHGLLNYMSVQKLRTPKGLRYIASLAKTGDRSMAMAMQQFQNLHCSIWAETVWALLDANETNTKFIISDHPVTVYNRDCFPGSRWCEHFSDPEIWLVGTHTLFPLTPTRVLVMTNLAWTRDPYQKATRERPNPFPLRPARPFDFRSIQTRRELTETEVNQINFIIKKRAYRYIAAPVEEWLYPETKIPSEHWRKLDDRYLLMPDPRAITFSGEIIIGHKSGPADIYDEYGHRPGQPGYKNGAKSEREWRTHLAFRGEYARLFGPRRRGRTLQFNRLDKEEDDPGFHSYHLKLEEYIPGHVKPRRGRRAS